MEVFSDAIGLVLVFDAAAAAPAPKAAKSKVTKSKKLMKLTRSHWLPAAMPMLLLLLLR